MNSFSNMEINDLLDNRFRLDTRHTPNYLAECFQRLFPTLGRMGLSTVIDEMARANHRAFNSSSLPIRGETLSLGFFFDLWKRGFRFEGGIYDKFTFGDELRLAFRINSREFWEVLIRADRDLGNYLKDSIELLKYRELPREISLNLRLNGSSVDDKTIRLLREKLPFNRDNFTTHEIAKVCLQLFEVANPADYDVRRLAEELEKENGIRRLSGEPLAVLPKKALDRLSTKCVLEFFKSKPLASSEASAMERGVYTVTEADLVLINNQGSEAFWQSIIPDKSIRERTLNMWKLAGMDSDARRFSAGKQILIATERALSDALHKHSAEMRDIYPLCGRAGISTQEADKFMAMLYLCHDFYKGLANVYINTAMLARFGAPAARRLWDTIKSEGLKKDGVGKIQGRLETETEKLNREVKEAIAKGTAKVTEIDLKQIDFTKYEPSKIDFDLRKIGLSQMVLMARSDYMGPDPLVKLNPGIQSFSSLDKDFQKHFIDTLKDFKKEHEKDYPNAFPIVLSSTSRDLNKQLDLMLEKLHKNSLGELYGGSIKNDSNRHNAYNLIEHLYFQGSKLDFPNRNPYLNEKENTYFKGLNQALQSLFRSYLYEEGAYQGSHPSLYKNDFKIKELLKVLLTNFSEYRLSISTHLLGKAVDISAWQNNVLKNNQLQENNSLKKSLIGFFRKKGFRVIVESHKGERHPNNVKKTEQEILQEPDWFFHVDKR